MAGTEGKSMEARLADAGRKIDAVTARARQARDDTRARVEQRVRILHAREATARAAVDPEAQASKRHRVEVDCELDQLDIEIAIAEAQLELDEAVDRAAFEAAVEREIEGYRAYLERLRTRAPARQHLRDELEAVGERTAAASERLRRFRASADEWSNSFRAGVLAALDDLDRAALQAMSKFQQSKSRSGR